MSTLGTGVPIEPASNQLRIGASSWSAESWEGVFYPSGMHPGDYLAHYASHFDTVEIDATFYRTPTERMVDGWRDKTPPGFLFAAKGLRKGWMTVFDWLAADYVRPPLKS